MIYLVTLERRPVRVMPDFVKAIRDNSSYYWKAMTNVWVVDTAMSAKQLYRALKQHIAAADLVLVVQIRPEYAGRLNKQTWAWLNTSRNNGDFERDSMDDYE
ncbi:hypothetical protein [Polyangium sp. y55x31]|uniref:hypothetical protein n=1 Tax=Polyangium sp. y55x31 TaxID=3042688 RepID=UPI002482A3EB|nr:hypothetical protein [Polyangium sp. y55x31]MDI1476763.1 hypothetical protein [Polyangium sp. y55x31]